VTLKSGLIDHNYGTYLTPGQHLVHNPGTYSCTQRENRTIRKVSDCYKFYNPSSLCYLFVHNPQIGLSMLL